MLNIKNKQEKRYQIGVNENTNSIAGLSSI